MAEIAAHTLTFNRYSNKRAQASVSVLVDSAIALYRGRLKGSNVAIHEALSKDTPPLDCYPRRTSTTICQLDRKRFLTRPATAAASWFESGARCILKRLSLASR